MQIVTLYSQYIFSLILFTVKNNPLFTPNNEIHKYTTRNNTNLHLPTVTFFLFFLIPPHVHTNFCGPTFCCGGRVTDFGGWDAHEAQLRCPDGVRGDI